MPIDSQLFRPEPQAVVPLRIGFSGRFDDPRKNIGLFLKALGLLLRQGTAATALLVGGRPTDEVMALIERLDLSGHVQFVGHSPHAELPRLLQTMDVFVVPSHQEGLCIAALEAMACGVPVVSTRCGGPEEFVIPGETGSLVGFDAGEMAEAVKAICNDRRLRQKLSIGARSFVENHYSHAHAEQVFGVALQSVFPHL